MSSREIKIMFVFMARNFIRLNYYVLRYAVTFGKITDKFSLTEISKKYDELDDYVQKLAEGVVAQLERAGISNVLCLELGGNVHFEYIKSFIFGSHFVQMARWLWHTKFQSDVSEDALTRYYQSSIGRPYCGFLRLGSPDWIAHRFEQFAYLNSQNFEFETSSYLEVGGATGMLALAAVEAGFQRVGNFEFNENDNRLLLQLATKSGAIEKLHLYTNSPKEVFDVISCHQVIEHVKEAGQFISSLHDLLAPGGKLFISTGYHVFPHPGHFFLPEDVFCSIMSDNHFLLKEKWTGHRYLFEKLPSTTVQNN